MLINIDFDIAPLGLMIFLFAPCRGEKSSPLEDLPVEEGIKSVLKRLHWLGHDTFRFETGEMIIYTDPWKIEGGPKADLVFITHDHYDHFSIDDIEKIRKDDTAFVAPSSVANKLTGDIVTVKPGDKLNVRGVDIEVVPAYNINKFKSPGVPFHPKGADYVGYIFTIDGKRVYLAGDTDVIPEMDSIETDIALLPVSGIYVMTADEAGESIKRLRTKVAIPMHIGKGIGSTKDAEKFKQISSVPSVILEMGK